MRHAVTLLVVCSFLTPLARAQDWSYQTIGADRKPLNVGSFRLSEPKPDQFVGRFLVPNLDICFQSQLNAKVERTPDQTLVILEPLMSGCQRIRLVINNDGSGGRREVHQADGTWKWDERERLLKSLRQ